LSLVVDFASGLVTDIMVELQNLKNPLAKSERMQHQLED
jgi:hypothetical protein